MKLYETGDLAKSDGSEKLPEGSDCCTFSWK